MSEPRESDEVLRERALQYALGTLEAAERRGFEASMAASGALRELVDAYRELAAELARLLPEEPPPRELWARIESAIGRVGPRALEEREGAPNAREVQPWKRWSPDAPSGDGFRFRADVDFEPTATAGVEVRRLALDAARDRATIEVRMAPGARYPAHRHGGVEECFVLEGDLVIGPVTMRAGDYQRLDAGTSHPVQTTRGGCRLLIVSSLRDELL